MRKYDEQDDEGTVCSFMIVSLVFEQSPLKWFQRAKRSFELLLINLTKL